MRVTSTLWEHILVALDNIKSKEIADIWNEYCILNGFLSEETIHPIEDFNVQFGGCPPLEIAKCVNRDFDPNDDWYWNNGIDGLESADCPEFFINFDDLAEYIIDNDEDFGNAEIRDLLDRWEEFEEYEEGDDDGEID